MKVVKYYPRTRLPHLTSETPDCDEKIISNKIYTTNTRDLTTGEITRWWLNTADYCHILFPIIREMEYSFVKSPFGESFKYVQCECIENILQNWGCEFVRRKYFYARTREEALEKFYGMKTTDDWKNLRENYWDIDRWRDEFEEKGQILESVLHCVDEYKSLAAELSQSPAPLLSELVRDSESYAEYIEKTEKLKSYEKALDILGIKHENYQCRI